MNPMKNQATTRETMCFGGVVSYGCFASFVGSTRLYSTGDISLDSSFRDGSNGTHFVVIEEKKFWSDRVSRA